MYRTTKAYWGETPLENLPPASTLIKASDSTKIDHLQKILKVSRSLPKLYARKPLRLNPNNPGKEDYLSPQIGHFSELQILEQLHATEINPEKKKGNLPQK